MRSCELVLYVVAVNDSYVRPSPTRPDPVYQGDTQIRHRETDHQQDYDCIYN